MVVVLLPAQPSPIEISAVALCLHFRSAKKSLLH